MLRKELGGRADCGFWDRRRRGIVVFSGYGWRSRVGFGLVMKRIGESRNEFFRCVIRASLARG